MTCSCARGETWQRRSLPTTPGPPCSRAGGRVRPARMSPASCAASVGRCRWVPRCRRPSQPRAQRPRPVARREAALLTPVGPARPKRGMRARSSPHGGHGSRRPLPMRRAWRRPAGRPGEHAGGQGWLRTPDPETRGSASPRSALLALPRSSRPDSPRVPSPRARSRAGPPPTSAIRRRRRARIRARPPQPSPIRARPARRPTTTTDTTTVPDPNAPPAETTTVDPARAGYGSDRRDAGAAGRAAGGARAGSGRDHARSAGRRDAPRAGRRDAARRARDRPGGHRARAARRHELRRRPRAAADASRLGPGRDRRRGTAARAACARPSPR